MDQTDADLFDRFTDILRDKTPPRTAPDIFEGDKADILAGLSVYRNNIRSSLSRVLGDKFPVLKQLVGDAFFKYVAHEYFHAHPPVSPMVVDYGDSLPGFLETFDAVETYPYLPDVARLEIAWLTAYHAADESVMTPDAIMAGIGDDIDAARVRLHPSLQLLHSEHPVASIWKAHQGDAKNTLGDVIHRAEAVLITRIHMDVTIRVLTPATFVALRALSTGQTLEAAVLTATSIAPDFDPNSFFQELFEFTLISGLVPEENT